MQNYITQVIERTSHRLMNEQNQLSRHESVSFALMDNFENRKQVIFVMMKHIK